MAVLDGSQPAAGTADDGKPIIICVDDDKTNLTALGRVLRARCTVMLADSGAAALELVEAHPNVSAVLADLRMPGMSGPDLLARVAQLRPHCRRAVVTGFPESEDLIPAINAGHLHYVITKPWKLQDLLQVVDQLIHTHRLERDNQRLLAELRIVNQSLRDHERQLVAQLDERGREISAATLELAKMGSQIDALTLRDPLTQLYTHRAFQERLREEVARAVRYGQPMSLLLGDIDGFASINYDLGYQAGDEILRKLASILQEADDRVRTSDVVARYSGEEFVLLLPETNKAGALTKAARLRDAVATADMPGGRRLSMSFGVAVLPEDAADSEGLLTAAESALRGAKRGGPGRVHFFSSGDVAGTPQSRTFAARVRQQEVDRFRPYQERMGEVTAILSRDRALACLFVDLSRLHRVELDLGVAHHSEIYDHAAAVLDRLRTTALDPADLICRTGDGDGYLVILAPRPPGARADLDALAVVVERTVEEALTPMVSTVLHEQPRITVGSARVLGNSLIRPERLTARLVAEAADAARIARERKAHRDRATLQTIILDDGLTSVYQPIVDLGTGDIFAYEALTRGPRGTSLESPATLFAIADEVELTVELDRACFRGALRSATTLEPVHRLFVNLLPMSFYDQAFIEIEVGNLLMAAGLTPANIVFEITERLAIENFGAFKRALAAYTAMGFGIAIDDVGTRHSNLETVLSLRPNFIKISDVLVRGVARSTVKREMLRSLRHIAGTIDAVMVAEGIEDVEDVAALRDLGLRYGQGYYMARPAPPFVAIKDEVRAELRAVTPNAKTLTRLVGSPRRSGDDDDDDNEDNEDDDDQELAIPVAKGSASHAMIPPIPPRSAFARTEDEITGNYQLGAIPGAPGTTGANGASSGAGSAPGGDRRPRGSQPPSGDAPPWQPLRDEDEHTESEALIEALRSPLGATPTTPSVNEKPTGDEPSSGRSGLN